MPTAPEPRVQPRFTSPPPAQPGSRVAVLSPSFAGPAVFPEVHERGLRALRDVFELEPVEFPTTRQLNAPAKDRAADLMAAFRDDSIAAVMASIGGSDQLTVLPHLDPLVFRDHPKRFFGYSDNTNFLNYLWNQGVVGYHGGSTMVHLARAGGLHPQTIASLKSALFTHDTVMLEPTEEFTDLSPEWHDLATLEFPVPTTPEPGWRWYRDDQVVRGPTWGGNLEILHWNLAANRWILPVEAYRGCVLLLETSEEMPPSDTVFAMLRDFGERGLLEQFPAVVVAKAKAWNHDHQLDARARDQFREDQGAAILRALGAYNPTALVVIGPDFGHTDPQLIIPLGGVMVVDGRSRTIHVTY